MSQSARDHGSCALCDELETELARVTTERDTLQDTLVRYTELKEAWRADCNAERQGRLQAEAERDALTRKSKADDIAFASMNRIAVEAEAERDDARAFYEANHG